MRPNADQPASRLAALVLAAGAAKRFGGDKLKAPFRGEPLLHHAIRAARAAPVERVLVVCAPGCDVGEWPGFPPVERVFLQSEALAASLRAGLAALSEAEGAFVFLGDMPLVPHGLAGDLATILGDNIAAQPLHEGKPGHPVLLSRKAFPLVAQVSGDRGAARLLRGRDDVARLGVDDAGIMLDVDRAEDFARLDAFVRHPGTRSRADR